MRPAPRRLFAIAFWAAVAFSFVMAVLPHPPQPPGHPSDKVQHVLAFVTVAALGRIAYLRVAAVRLGILLSLFGALIELVQAIPALQRDSDWRDWLADSAAIVAVLLIARVVRRRRA